MCPWSQWAQTWCSHPPLPVKSVPELIAYAKTRPETIRYASSGVASPHHLAAELLKAAPASSSCTSPIKEAQLRTRVDRRRSAHRFHGRAGRDADDHGKTSERTGHRERETSGRDAGSADDGGVRCSGFRCHQHLRRACAEWNAGGDCQAAQHGIAEDPPDERRQDKVRRSGTGNDREHPRGMAREHANGHREMGASCQGSANRAGVEKFMEYRRIGNSGLKVSELCLGTMTFGDRTDEATAKRIAAAAVEAGVNFIDTADGYAKGLSEEITGKIVAQNREHWVLATKVFNPMGGGPNRGGLGRKWLMYEIDASLKRLNTDYVDIWYFHVDDRDTPVEESVAAVSDVIRSGKARYFGLSNYQGWRIAQVVHTCERLGVPRPIVCQPYYNAMNRQPELEVIPACLHYGLGIVPYSPLARGVLTGKYLPGQAPPEESRAGRKDRRMMKVNFGKSRWSWRNR